MRSNFLEKNFKKNLCIAALPKYIFWNNFSKKERVDWTIL